MLQTKSEDEPMVTKKKSKIPCLSLSSFLPALEGTVHLCDLYLWPRRYRLRSLVSLQLYLVRCRAMRLCGQPVNMCSVRSNTYEWCSILCCCSTAVPVFCSLWLIFLIIDNNKFLFRFCHFMVTNTALEKLFHLNNLNIEVFLTTNDYWVHNISVRWLDIYYHVVGDRFDINCNS